MVTVHGRAAHAGVEPEKGRSAILAAAHLVVGLHGLNGRWPGVTCNVGVIEGGIRPNVVAERTVLQVDLRAVDRAAMEAADAAIRALAAAPAVPDVTIDVELRHRHWPMEKLARSAGSSSSRRGWRRGSGSRSATPRRAARRTPTRPPGWASRRSTAWGRSAAWTTRRRSGSTWPASCPRTTLFAALLLATGRDPEVRGWREAAGDGPACRARRPIDARVAPDARQRRPA